MINKVELLAPAGDCNRGKTALDFGADAIYFGARQYSLRAKASNFDTDDINEISIYAHNLNKKIYLVTNILCHSHMADGFLPFLNSVQKYKPDAYICSDPYIIKTIHEYDKDAQIHISTQQSVSNSKAALFWQRNGATRIILSREVTFDELKQMIINIDKKIEIEVFIHGAVCIAYSGRCMLSNNFCFRDANIGGCAQSCRWSLKLLDGNHQLISEHFTMSAKDMCQITNVKNLIEIGVTSFKIEGRMKSEHYIATVVNDYRKTIDAYYNNIEIGDQYINDIKAAANRETSFAWYYGKPGIDQMLYHEIPKTVTQNFVLTVIDKINDTTYSGLTRNYFDKTTSFEILGRKLIQIENARIISIKQNNEEIDAARTPMSKVVITFDKPLDLVKNDIIRIK